MPLALLEVTPSQQFRQFGEPLLGKPRSLGVVARLSLKVLRKAYSELPQFGEAALACALGPHELELCVDNIRRGLSVVVFA